MGGVSGQPGTKPSQAVQPTAADSADAFLADFSAPKVAAPAAGDSADAFLSDMQGGGAPAAPVDDQFAPDSNPLSLSDTVRDNVSQFNPESFVTRIQAGLAANDTEKMNFLAKKYGPGNVAMKDDKIYYRKDPTAKMKPLDPATFELISDILPDFAREIVTEGAMLPGEITGGIVGSAEPGFGTAAGALAGRVASVPMANSVADGVAQLAGVHGDEARSRTTENLIGMGAEAILPVLGGKVVKAIAKRIPGTMAYKAAIDAGEKEVVALSKQSQKVVEAADDLAKEGVNVEMMSHQVHNSAPDLLKKAQTVEALPQFIQKQQEFAEGYGQALENNLKTIAREANPTKASPSATAITSAVESLDKLEGQTIGMYENKALAKTRNARAPLPEKANAIAEDAMRKMGFTPKTVRKEVLARPNTIEGAARRGIEARNVVEQTKWNPPTNMEEVAGTFGLDASQSRVMTNALNKYGTYMSKGGEARLTEVKDLINYLGPITQKLRGTEGGRVISQLTGELRQHRRALVEAGLGDADKPLFNAAMDKFGMIRKNTEDLSGILGNDITAKAVVNHFFKAGAGPERVAALKAITGGEKSPQWGALKEEFINQLLLKHADSKSATGFKSAAFLNDLQKNYGDDFMKEVMNSGSGPNYQTVKNLLIVGQRIEEMSGKIKLDKTSDKQKRGAVEALFGFVTNGTYRMANGLGKLVGASGNKENVLMEILNRDGVEKYLASYKGSARKQQIASVIEPMLAQYNAARSADNVVNGLLNTGKDLTKRGIRADLREDVEH